MKQYNRKTLLGVIVPLGLGAILVIIILQVGNLALANSPGKTPTPADPVINSLGEQIRQLDEMLNQTDVSPDIKEGIQAKEKYLEKQATQRAEYLGNQEEALQTKLTAIAGETQSPSSGQTQEPAPREGLYTEFYAPKYREAVFSTGWLVRTEEGLIFYMAGALVDDPDQGIIYVENKSNGIIQKYKTPGKDGSLKISKLDKNRLYLDSKKGKKYLFNINKKNFVDELDNPIPETAPTLTPIPAYP